MLYHFSTASSLHRNRWCTAFLHKKQWHVNLFTKDLFTSMPIVVVTSIIVKPSSFAIQLRECFQKYSSHVLYAGFFLSMYKFICVSAVFGIVALYLICLTKHVYLFI